MAEKYYTAPNDEIFNHIKLACLVVWAKYYEDSRPYMVEKMSRVLSIGNVSDNYMHLIAMFDCVNQRELFEMLSEEAAQYVQEALEEAGSYSTVSILTSARRESHAS